MPSFRKRLFCLLLASLGLASQGPAWALEGQIKERTAFCLEAQKDCQALFYLTPQDTVRVLRQSLDENWYFVHHDLSQQDGWVQSKDLALSLPTKITGTSVASPPAEGLALLAEADQLYVLSREQRFKLTEGHLEADAPLAGLQDLLPPPKELWLSFARPDAPLLLLGLTRQEETLFVQEVVPSPDPYPRYHTLLRLKKNEDFRGAALTQNQNLLLLAEGEASWGNSLLIALDPHFLPLMLIRKDLEFLTYLPNDILRAIRNDSLQVQGLTPDGLLLLSAYDMGSRKKVLLTLRYDPQQFWVYEGLYNWPQQVPLEPKSEGLRLRGLKDGEQFYLLLSQKSSANTYLAFYAGERDAISVQVLDQPVRDATLFQHQLWTLQEKSLKRWTLDFEPK